jgi:hypothetical protein
VRPLKTCKANLDTCQTDLEACQEEPKHFSGDELGGPGFSYRDYGNGTFTDTNTGLMWEKKVFSSGGLHDANRLLSYPDAAGFIATLNTSHCLQPLKQPNVTGVSQPSRNW